MPGILLPPIISKAGRTLYRQGSRFVSKQTWLRESRRIGKGLKGAGRFMSKADHARGLSSKGIADQLMAEFGPPIGGGDWVSRVRGSTDKFTDFLAQDNQLG